MAITYPFYQVNAFTSEPFKGNPAAVCLIDEWPGNEILQNIAADNNLSETAFLKQVDEDYEIRWFTPTMEVELCGHATLASAFVVFEYLHPHWDEVIFHTRYAGDLFLRNDGELLSMELPKVPVEQKSSVEGIEKLNAPVKEIYEGDKLILVLDNEASVAHFTPDMEVIKKMHDFGVAITAPANDNNLDFVSRFFVPHAGIMEDPVTGSLHCALGDLWEQKLGKSQFKARQLSKRGGELEVEMKGERVLIKGEARKVIEGEFFV